MTKLPFSTKFLCHSLECDHCSCIYLDQKYVNYVEHHVEHHQQQPCLPHHAYTFMQILNTTDNKHQWRPSRQTMINVIDTSPDSQHPIQNQQLVSLIPKIDPYLLLGILTPNNYKYLTANDRQIFEFAYDYCGSNLLGKVITDNCQVLTQIQSIHPDVKSNDLFQQLMTIYSHATIYKISQPIKIIQNQHHEDVMTDHNTFQFVPPHLLVERTGFSPIPKYPFDCFSL